MASLIVFFLLFILPFTIAPFGITQFENPKVIFAEAGIILLFLVLLFKNNISFHNRGAHLVLYSGIILVTLIDIFFFRTNISFFGNAFRMQGIFLLWLLLLFSLLSSQVPSFRVPWWIYLLLLGIETIVIFFLPLNASQRYVGTLGEPNALAAFAIFLWPFAWFGMRSKRWEFLGKTVLLFLVCVILYVSGSRSGMIAFCIQITYVLTTKFTTSWVAVYNKKAHDRELRTVNPELIVKIAVIFCLFLYAASYAFPFFEHVLYENRAEIWQAAFYAGMINPGLGHGFGNTEIALHNAAAGIDLPIQYYYVDSSHNIFLDWWVQGGVIGVSLLLLLVSLSFRAFIQQQKKRELVLLLGMLTVLSFNPASVVGLLGFWWILGQTFA